MDRYVSKCFFDRFLEIGSAKSQGSPKDVLCLVKLILLQEPFCLFLYRRGFLLNSVADEILLVEQCPFSKTGLQFLRECTEQLKSRSILVLIYQLLNLSFHLIPGLCGRLPPCLLYFLSFILGAVLPFRAAAC